MAGKTNVSKQVLQWEVVGSDKAEQSLTRAAALQRATVKASQELNAALTDLTVRSNSLDLAKTFGKDVKKGLTDSASAAKMLADELARAGANKGDILAAATAFREASGQGGFNLKTFGSNLKGLPALQLPGLGISTDAVGKLSQLFGSLEPKALAAGAAIGITGAALVLLTNQAKAAAEAAKAELDARDRAIKLLATGSRDSIQQRLNELEATRKVNALIKSDADALVDSIRQQTIKDKGGGAALAQEINSILGTGGSELQQAKVRADEAAKSLNSTSTELALLTQQSGLTAQSLDAIAAAANRIEFIGSDITNRAAADLEANNAAYFGNSKALEDRRNSLKLEINVLAQSIAEANALADALGRQTAEGDKAAQGAKELALRYNAASTSLEALSNSYIDSAIAARELADYQKKQAEDTAAAVKKYNQETTNAVEADLQKRADLERSYQDALIKAAQTLAEAGEKALASLRQKQADLLTSLGRDSDAAARKNAFDALQKQIDYQADAAKASRDHYRDLRDIRERAEQVDEDAIASRNFTLLYQNRRDTSQAILASNRAFEEQQAEQAEAYRLQNEASARQTQFEQSERLIKYQQANEDAAKNYNRELAQAALANQKALAAAADAYSKELSLQDQKNQAALSILNKGITAELQLIQASADARVRIAANELAQLNAQAQLILTGGINATGSAAGFGGSSAGFAGVAANINNINGSRTNNISQTFNVSGNNQALVDMIDARVSRTIRSFLN